MPFMDSIVLCGDFVLCPNCGYTSAPGTMFCGKCGSRLASAPAQPNPYTPPVQPAPPASPYGTYTPPQRSAYTPPAAPAESVSYNSYSHEAARPNYQSYSSPMMQSPYISGGFRAPSPVLSSSREGAAQYTAVSTNVYSPQARAAAVASEHATKKKKAGKIVMTIAAILLLVGMAAILYFSGVFKQSDNGIYVPPSSGESSENTPTAKPTEKPLPTVSESDPSDVPVVSDSDTENSKNENAVPGNLNSNDFAEVNAFLSAFTETGLLNINSSVSSNELADFAVTSLSMNSSVYSYSSSGFSHGSNTYNYSLSESVVKQRISRYFGENVQLYPAVGDSGEGWMYYGGNYYFTEIAKSEGFAIVTEYSKGSDVVDVSFNIYASDGNDSDYYSMTAKEAEDAGCTLIGSGTATLGITSYNGRNTYLMQSVDASIN